MTNVIVNKEDVYLMRYARIIIKLCNIKRFLKLKIVSLVFLDRI